MSEMTSNIVRETKHTTHGKVSAIVTVYDSNFVGLILIDPEGNETSRMTEMSNSDDSSKIERRCNRIAKAWRRLYDDCDQRG